MTKRLKAATAVCLATLFVQFCYGQDFDFPFGEFTYKELQMSRYDNDTSASAVVLNEFGDAYISSGDEQNLVFNYHVKIKILKADGLDEANFTVYLRKQDGREEMLKSVEATTFTLVNGSAKESKFDGKSIFTQNVHANLNVKKFTLSNVQVGSVIDVRYTVESPFYYNFKSWEFQSNLPKMKSAYWATIPANYLYYITLRGFLSLSYQNSEVIKDCFTPTGRTADCTRYKFVMKDIPAFIEEDYMTAASNYIAAISFELSQITYFDGRKDKIAKEWKDAEQELRQDTRFGVQLKRGKDILDEKVEEVIAGEQDSLGRARKIYLFIRDWFQWNDGLGKYSEFGIKKAFTSKTGNVGDINLSLLAALTYAGFLVEPLILSTRENGLPVDLHPVLSDFNYVIAKLTVGHKVYLLDATERNMPFGMLPMRCLNGKGRVIGEKGSYWHEINPPDKLKEIAIINLVLDADGFFRGTVNRSYVGYAAVAQRKKIKSFESEQKYIASQYSQFKVVKHELSHLLDDDKSLNEKLTIEMEGFQAGRDETFFFNPHILDKWTKNPFKSSERMYPVDFGIPIEETMVMEISLPPNVALIDPPEKIGLGLPNKGGRYLFSVEQNGNKIRVNHSFVISKAVFSSQEYRYLKEFFGNLIQAENTDLIFKGK